MKKLNEKQRTVLTVACILILIAIAFIVFWTSSAREVGYMYVAYTDENGFMGSINGLGRVYVEYEGADQDFDEFDTVRITWKTENLHEENGTIINPISGNPDLYEFVMNPSTARKSIPWLGEPLYG
jgi:hypothetical protein